MGAHYAREMRQSLGDWVAHYLALRHNILMAHTIDEATDKAQTAVDRSIARNMIVTLDYDEAVLDVLRGWSDDNVDGNTCIELWGTDDDGSEWRVHMLHAEEG